MGWSHQVQNFQGLVAIRIFLGLFEGGLLPGIVSPFGVMHIKGNVLTYLDRFYT